MPVLDRGVARGDFMAYIGADNTFGVNWQESTGAAWVPRELSRWTGRFEIWSLDKSTLYYRQEGKSGYNGFQLDDLGNITVTVPAEVFTDPVWLTRETVMYRLYAIPPQYNTDFNLITRDEVYKNFCTLAECNDHITEIKRLIKAEEDAHKAADDELSKRITSINNTINDLVNKVYGGGNIGSDGHITWPNDAKIAIGKLNIYSGGAEGDVYNNAIRTRTANSENDTKAS
nr:MAG TPA: hypothetical protein [Caudoviricetes sp.]